jgi:hypothetical protein
VATVGHYEDSHHVVVRQVVSFPGRVHIDIDGSARWHRVVISMCGKMTPASRQKQQSKAERSASAEERKIKSLASKPDQFERPSADGRHQPEVHPA